MKLIDHDGDVLALMQSAYQAACQHASDDERFTHDDPSQAVRELWQAMTFEALAHGLHDERAASLLRTCGYSDDTAMFAIAGTPKDSFAATRTGLRAMVRDLGGKSCLVGQHGAWCVAAIPMQAAVTPEVACATSLPLFAEDNPVCLCSARRGVLGAAQVIQAVVMALRAASSVPNLPRPMRADDVLPERALLGDPLAREDLYHQVYASLHGEGNDDAALTTVATFLSSGSSLELTAKTLNVHPNTVRYRLKKAAESTGWDATAPREAYVLQTAIAIGRMMDAEQA